MVTSRLGTPVRSTGFTLIELLVVLSIIALMLTIAVPRYFSSVEHSKEAVLRENLKVLRTTLDKFYGDTGRYPDNLEELVARNYLRAIPPDPMTDSAATWVVTSPPDASIKGVYDLKSGASGKTRDGIEFGQL